MLFMLPHLLAARSHLPPGQGYESSVIARGRLRRISGRNGQRSSSDIPPHGDDSSSSFMLPHGLFGMLSAIAWWYWLWLKLSCTGVPSPADRCSLVFLSSSSYYYYSSLFRTAEPEFIGEWIARSGATIAPYRRLQDERSGSAR